MAIVFLQQKKRQKSLALVFILVVLITAVIIWWGFFKKEKEILYEETIILPQKEVKIDFEILKNPFLEELQPFSKIESFEEATSTKGEVEEKLGRENPFLPY